MNRKAVLVVSFGTSYKEARISAIEKIEEDIGRAFPSYDLKRAFTSPKIIKKLKERDSIFIDNADEALCSLEREGYKEVIIVPTFIIGGIEYDNLLSVFEKYKEKFDVLKIGTPLLYDDKDYAKAAEIMKKETEAYIEDESSVIFMGHGTSHAADDSYEKLQREFDKIKTSEILIGTVEGKKGISDVVLELKRKNIKKAVICPFMIVAGDHANNDMAGEGKDSWKNILKSEGFEVKCLIKGLGEYEGIRKMITDKAKALL